MPPLDRAAHAMLDWLREQGCTIEAQPSNATDMILTTALYGSPIDRDDALFFQAKRRYGLNRRPTVWTMMAIRESDYQRWIDHFAELAQYPENAKPTFEYPGLGPQAVEVLMRQARRGGPEVAISRLLQCHVKSLRIMALRIDDADQPICAMHYDLAGAHAITPAGDLDVFAQDAGYRLLTASCAREVNQHVFAPDVLPRSVWNELHTPDDLLRAGPAFTEYGFFTTPVSIEKLLGFRGVGDAISSQYSEGCYGAYDPDVNALITTATGSSRLVDKRWISRSDQALVVDLKPERDGVIVREVEGMGKVVPSVEAVEMMSICRAVAKQNVINRSGEGVEVPLSRAILHGHLAVADYDPAYVERAQLDDLYYAHLVSCGTGPLARATSAAFGRSATLNNIDDPRKVVFLEQPGHGAMLIEKWVPGTRAFETTHAYLRAGHLRMTMDVPQGPVEWRTVAAEDGRQRVQKVGALSWMSTMWPIC